jgi:AcrR family transcriptional regulator
MTRRTAHRPRKDALQSRSRATVDAILEAAARILERGGEAAANTNAIAEAAGVSVGSLYQYFPGKEAIFTTLLLRAERSTLAKLSALVEGTKERLFKERLSALVDAAVRQQFDRPLLARALDQFESRAPRLPDLVEADRAIVQLLAALLRAHRGDHTCSRYMEAAGDLHAIVKGIVDSASERGETDLVRLKLRVERAVVGYLGSGPNRRR